MEKTETYNQKYCILEKIKHNFNIKKIRMSRFKIIMNITIPEDMHQLKNHSNHFSAIRYIKFSTKG